MRILASCPVCGSKDSELWFEGTTNRRPADSTLWRVSSCHSCGHGFMDPQPTWDELSVYYNETYDPYVRNHGAQSDGDAEAVSQAVASGTFRHIAIPREKRLLDVGCGAGWFLRICKQLGADVFGIEPSRFGTLRCREAGLEVYNGMVEDYLDECGAERKFDVITANHVIEHAPDPIRTLRAMKTLLAPEGMLWVSVPNAKCFFRRAIGSGWHSTDLPYHLQQFSSASIELAGANAGLAVRRAYTYSLPGATAGSLRQLLRSRFLFPQRISMRIGFLNNIVAPKVAAYLDRKGDGEATIVEFAV